MKQFFSRMKRILALLIVFGMVAGLVPAPVLAGMGAVVAGAVEPESGYELNNGYIKVTVSEKTGGFGIRTVEGDKVNKSDNDKYLVFEYDEDNTSFTSFQVTRDGQTKEYIFGGKYPGSSGVSVSKTDSEITAAWSVDGLTFKQIITLENSGSTEHGAVLISYAAENSGAPAAVKSRILMDTALGYQDYAYYRVGKTDHEREIALGEDGYDKSFYAMNNPFNPTIVAYTINAAVNNQECKPYKTIFAHWNNLASTVFDYTPDPDMTFTNFSNVKYLTSDSAYALYFDLGQIAEGQTASAATNYGVYSNETMDEKDTVAVNVNAPDVIQFAKNPDGSESQTVYENDGRFSVKTHFKNIGYTAYTDICIVVTTAGCITALDQEGNIPVGVEDGNYSMQITDVTPGEQLDIDWNFVAQPQEAGQYSRIQYKVYDVSDEATGNTGTLMRENLLGEGYSYILCPGSVDKMPALKFTAASPDTVFTSGVRNLNITGENFSMLLDKSAYNLKISRVDGMKIDGQSSFTIPGDQFTVDDSMNVISLIMNEENPGKLPEGRYKITVDYVDPDVQDLSARALEFHVSDDERYRNESYGFLAVRKDDGNTYVIEKFFREENYWDWLEGAGIDRSDVLLELQGLFTAQRTEDGSKVYLGVSNNKSHNVMTLNGSLDIRSGSCTVTEKDGTVTVDFDADLYTTGSNTFVYSGVAALTALEAGTEYELIPYTENGEREDMTGEPIALLWPSVGESFQNLMGLLFNLRFGELGVISHEEAPAVQGSQTRLVAFGAAMDLSFLIPESVDEQFILDRGGKTKDALGSSWDAAEHNSIQFSADEIRALNKRANYRDPVADTEATMEDVDNGRFSDMTVDDTPGYNTAYVVIDDILFGGEYLGVNMEVALGIPPYIMNMPALECVLSVHTVGDWSFGVDGQCHFGSFKLQASLQILSHEGMPIVDSMSFYLGGFQPGFNIDGVGVLWLQGAHGGIENIYDTIFLTDKIPPLKLIIGTQFSIMQIFDAYATMGLSLRGVELTLTNGQFLDYTNPETQVVIKPQPITLDGSVKLDWYPEFYFHAAVNLAIAMAIRGSGYIVADQSGFYEFFIRGSLSIPSDIPIIGGYEVGGIGLGVNTQKLWGRLDYLSRLKIGVTYYWGGDIDWSSGSDAVPTYPELLGDNAGVNLMAIPVGYDTASNRTLYMALGSNMRVSADTQGNAGRTGASIKDLITTDPVHAGSHTMKLEKNGSGKILSIQWTAEDEEQAREEARNIVLVNNADPTQTIPVRIWSGSAAGDANANFSYDPESKTAYLSIAFASDDADVYGKTWNIATAEGALLVVYDVLPMPEVTLENVEVTGNAVRAELGGYSKESFTRLTVVAEGKNHGQVYLLGGAMDPFADGETVLDLTMPEQAMGDTYTLRLVCSDDAASYYHEATAEFDYVNPNQPQAPTAVSAENAGDYKVAVHASASGEFDGYQFTAFDSEGQVVSGMSGILMNRDGSSVSYDGSGRIQSAASDAAADSYIIGGQFVQMILTGENAEQAHVTGLQAGEYTIEVRTWKRVADGVAVLLSEPVTTAVTVREPVESEIRVSASTADGKPSVTKTMTAGGESYQLTIFGSSDLVFTLSSTGERFTGKWSVDGGFRENLRGEITEATNLSNLVVTGLDDGEHLLQFRGRNQYGDAVAVTYSFAVDTLPPRMLLDAPVNGSLFDYWTGALEISGVTDQNVTIHVMDNTTGKTVLEKTAAQVDEDGRFNQPITLDRQILKHDLTITLADALGNESVKDVTVMSNGLGSIEKLMIYAGAQDVTNTKLTAGTTYGLQLMAKLKSPAGSAEEDLIVRINHEGMVDWIQDVAEGTSSLEYDPDGATLTTSSDAEGMVTALFQVSDLGAYSVSAAFGYTGQQIQNLDSTYTQIVTTDQLYTGEPRTTDIQVWYRGIQLIEGTDYTVGDYTNNVEVTTVDSKAQVEVIGMGAYGGTAVAEFDISYLELDERWITVSGQEGNNGCYVSDVSIEAAEGYELVVDGEASRITFSTDGEHSVTFRVRRLSDGAMTDLVTRTVTIDKTAPTGTITLDQTGWSTFLEFITFGAYKVDDLAATVTAEDANGIAGVEYVITEEAYASVTELEAAGVNWESYSETWKPTLKENRNQIIYVRITDMAGNVSYISSDGIHVDTLAPEVTVTITGTTSSSVSFTITSSEAGTYYYTVLKATDEIPTAEQVKLGHSGTVLPEGAALTAGGLEKNVAYVIYAVAEDEVFKLSTGASAPNTSAVAFSHPVTTDRVNLGDEDAAVEIQISDALYTGAEVKPAVKVLLGGEELVEGIDYEVTYHENVEVSSDKPYVRVIGINGYAGVLTANFAIRYLELDESWITISGTEGSNGYYVSDVSILPATGYELVVDGEAARITFGTDGEHSVTFRVRRLSDGAMTDLVTRTVTIDKTAPTGTITLDGTGWDKFLEFITFGAYKVDDLAATVTAEDANGIAGIEYVITETAYASATGLETAGLTWESYSENRKPTLKENKNQIIYVRFTDMAGNVSYISTDGIHVDTLAPVVSISVDASSVTDSGFSFTITSNEVGKYDYAVVKATEPMPTAEDLLTGNVPGGIVGSGNISAGQVGQPIALTVSGLEANTAYTVYAVAEDTVIRLSDGSAAPNVSGVASGDPVVTAQFGLDNAEVTVEDMLYTGQEVEPDVEVVLDGKVLTEGRDYEVVYHENVEASDTAPYVEIIGIGDYGGTVKAHFAIRYLELGTEAYTISGTLGENGYYVSAVTVGAKDGCELVPVADSLLQFHEDGIHETKFHIRRLSDGAMTDVYDLQIKIDMTAPEVSGIVDGGVYIGEVTFTVSDDNLDTVTINGEEVSGSAFTLQHAEGQQTIVITDKAGNTISLTVTVKDPGCSGGTGCPSSAYVDLDHEAWYHPFVDYVIENGLMQGYSSTIFAPCDNLSRAMMVQVLYSLEGRPAVSGEQLYTDVPEGTWFFDAILWASEKGMVVGYGNGNFGPGDPITREQMALIFYRYSQARGYSLTEGSYEHFKDHGDISGYAQQAMRWAVGNGLMAGCADNRLHPRDYTSRVEFAAMLRHFLENIAK